MNPMKALIWTFLVMTLHCVSGDAQILHYQFDEGFGTTTASWGSTRDSLRLRDSSGNSTTALWGAPGSGPSGLASDRALDLTTATGMGTGYSGPSAFLPALSPTPALTEFTITGWFRPSRTDLDRAKFLLLQNGSNLLSVTGLSGGPAGARSRLRFIIDDGDFFPEVDVGDFESDWSTADAWAFFAITYSTQGATSTIKMYSGNLAAAASLSTSSTGRSILFPFTGASVCIGANPSSTDPFRGYLDDFRFYGSALTATEVEQVRLSGIMPAPRLSIARVDAAALRLSWPKDFTNHVLEFATSPPATDWSVVTNAVTTVDEHRSVILDTSQLQRFYRLRQP
jgi:hypothetical protein